MAKAPQPATVYHKVKAALEKERDGLTFAKLARAAGITQADLTRSMSLLQSCNLIVIDRRSRRWVLAGR